MDKSKFKYQPFFCEENIWHLAREIGDQFSSSYVLFISSPHEVFPIWHQDQASGSEEVLFWDYHAIFLIYDNQWKILDFNTLLSFPEEAIVYFKQSFRPEHIYHFIYPPLFKFIETNIYLTQFSSDRSHMRQSSGNFMKPPPPWPLVNSHLKPNFTEFIDFNSKKFGEILNLEEVINYISK